MILNPPSADSIILRLPPAPFLSRPFSDLPFSDLPRTHSCHRNSRPSLRVVPPAVPAVPTSLLLRHLERLSRALPYIDWKGANNGGNNGGPATGGGGASAQHTTDRTDPLLAAAQKYRTDF